MSGPADALPVEASPGNTFRRIRRGRAWEYRINRARVPSVTTCLNAINKPLKRWAARTAAEYTADNISMLTQITRGEIIDLVSGAPDRSSNMAARIGTDVHDRIARYMLGEELVVEQELEAWINQYQDFEAHFLPQDRAYLIEQAVFSVTGQYAGTFDLFGELAQGWGATLLDVKTSGDVYPDYSLQLAGYLGAEYLEGGERVPWASEGRGWPRVRCAVLWLRHDAWELMPVEVGRPEFAGFMAARVMTAWQETRAGMVLTGGRPEPTLKIPRPRLEVVK
jgi:hypothetical protein